MVTMWPEFLLTRLLEIYGSLFQNQNNDEVYFNSDGAIKRIKLKPGRKTNKQPNTNPNKHEQNPIK